jgi:hypothetical protein
MPKEKSRPAYGETKSGAMPDKVAPTASSGHQSDSEQLAERAKLSVTVDHDSAQRLRTLAHACRLSESSIVGVALTMFFARGDDALLGAMLEQLGATLRRR